MSAVQFCDLAKLMKENYKYKTNVSDFLPELIDEILDIEEMDQEEINPIYSLAKSTREAYYRGKDLQIAQKKAAVIAPRIDEEKFADFVDDYYSMDALDHMRDKLSEFGFDVPSNEVGKALANILAQIIRLRAEGRPADVVSLNYGRHESGRLLKDVAPATIELKNGKLHIAGEIFSIPRALVPDNIHQQELDYIKALYEVYAEKLHMDKFTEKDAATLKRAYADNYKEQRLAYYSAISVERSVRDIFYDGEDEFSKLKDDAWHGINTTYWKDYEDGYSRLNAVLEKVTSTTLNESVLSQMRGLIGNLEKKGICHILVNDGVIVSWVNVDE